MSLIVIQALITAFVEGAGVATEADLPPAAQAQLFTMRQQAIQSIGAFADAIYSQEPPAPEDEEDTIIAFLARGTLWTVSLAGAFGAAQLWEANQEQAVQWRLGGTIEHCVDCLRLDAQVHTRAEWRASGWLPQSRGLTCGGWNCDCGFFDVDLPLTGGF